MTEPEYKAGIESGAITVEAIPEAEEKNASPVSNTSVEQFIPLLTQLQSTQRCLTAVPTFVPQTFQDQIQFVFTAGDYYLYLYFNNQWNSFSINGTPGVTQILAGSGISISPG